MKGKCPFKKIKCEECVFYRKGLRYYDNVKEPTAFEECAINIGIDCLENMISRNIAQQKAIEETRNEVSKLMDFFLQMSQMKVIEQ